MNVTQRVVLIITALACLCGSYAIIYTNEFSVINLTLLYLFIGIPARLIYVACCSSAPTKLPALTISHTIFKHSSKAQFNSILFSAKTVWPFQLFADRLIIQEKNIGIIRKSFFMTHWSDTIQLNDIGSVILNSGPFLASLSIYLKLPQKEFTINNLQKRHAVYAKELIDGLLLVKENLITIPEDSTIPEKRKLLRRAANESQLETQVNRM